MKANEKLTLTVSGKDYEARRVDGKVLWLYVVKVSGRWVVVYVNRRTGRVKVVSPKSNLKDAQKRAREIRNMYSKQPWVLSVDKKAYNAALSVTSGVAV